MNEAKQVTGQILLNKSESTKLNAGNESKATGEVHLVPGTLTIDGPVITQVDLTGIDPDADLGGPDFLLCPGFIDTHLHLPQFEMIGAHGMPLLSWLQTVTFPAERRWQDANFARAMTHRVIDQCFSNGTTSICAYATVHAEATAAALEVATERGISGVIGHVLMDQEAPEDFKSAINEQIDRSAALLDRFPPGTRMAAAVTPRFAVSCSAELLEQAGKLAAERDTIIQTHLAETEKECGFVRQLFGGKSYVQVYEDAGLLTPKAIFGHGIYLDDLDCAKLATAGSTIAHCPTANSFLRSGTMNRAELLNQSVSFSLGSDIGAGYERSMVRVARAMIESAALVGDPFPNAAQAWWQITHGNASSLGIAEGDRLQSDRVADVLLIKPDIPWLENDVDPLANLLFAWDDRWLKQTIVSGNVVYSS